MIKYASHTFPAVLPEFQFPWILAPWRNFPICPSTTSTQADRQRGVVGGGLWRHLTEHKTSSGESRLAGWPAWRNVCPVWAARGCVCENWRCAALRGAATSGVNPAPALFKQLQRGDYRFHEWHFSTSQDFSSFFLLSCSPLSLSNPSVHTLLSLYSSFRIAAEQSSRLAKYRSLR